VAQKLQDHLESTALKNLDLDKIFVDYGWLWWLAKPLSGCLTLIHLFVINWGIAIILIVVCVEAIFLQVVCPSLPFNGGKMRKFGPEIG